MKSIIFDSGPIISLTMNNLLWTLEPLKKHFNGEFYIPAAVKSEIIDRPLGIKRFEFEAMQVRAEIDCKVIQIIEEEKTHQKSMDLLDLANHSFYVKGTNINIVSIGEMSVLAAALMLSSQAVAMDERTTRDLIERPERIARHLQENLGKKVTIENSNIKQLRGMIKEIKVIRSVELAAVAFEIGLLDGYIDRCRNPSLELKKKLLDSVLWGVKLQGCAVSENEINQIIEYLMPRVE